MKYIYWTIAFGIYQWFLNILNTSVKKKCGTDSQHAQHLTDKYQEEPIDKMDKGSLNRLRVLSCFCLWSSWAPCRWLLLLGRVGAAFIERGLSFLILFIIFHCTIPVVPVCLFLHSFHAPSHHMNRIVSNYLSRHIFQTIQDIYFNCVQ
jgi:hypothetical protein